MSINFDILLSENKDFKIVKVKFNTDQKEYIYKTCLDLQVNDLIVVPARDTFTVVTVTQVMSYAEYFSQRGGFNVKWVVQKIDLSTFERMNEIELKLKKAEQEIVLENLKQEMRKSETIKKLLDTCNQLLIESK